MDFTRSHNSEDEFCAFRFFRMRPPRSGIGTTDLSVIEVVARQRFPDLNDNWSAFIAALTSRVHFFHSLYEEVSLGISFPCAYRAYAVAMDMVSTRSSHSPIDRFPFLRYTSVYEPLGRSLPRATLRRFIFEASVIVTTNFPKGSIF